jgi:hypothetical protein
MPASIRHLVPGSFVFSLIVMSSLSLFWPPALWISLGIGLVYLCCTVIASIITAAKHGWSYLPILPLVFACYHFGYGIGFIKGVIDFMILGRVPSDRFRTLTRSSARPLPRS